MSSRSRAHLLSEDEALVVRVVLAEPTRQRIAEAVVSVGPPDALLAAGYVRNAVWDYLHGYDRPTPLNDVDVVYHDRRDISSDHDAAYETALQAALGVSPRLSVKNQARMHVHNGDQPYASVQQAMRRWPETCTAVGLRLAPHPYVCAPFGLADLLALKVRPTDRTGRMARLVQDRARAKGWFQRWPRLALVDP